MAENSIVGQSQILLNTSPSFDYNALFSPSQFPTCLEAHTKSSGTNWGWGLPYIFWSSCFFKFLSEIVSCMLSECILNPWSHKSLQCHFFRPPFAHSKIQFKLWVCGWYASFMQAYDDESLKEGKFPSKKSLILLVCTSDIPWVFCFYIEESILPERKWQTKIMEEEIDPINNNDHCSGLLRSGEGGSDNLVEHHLPNLPVQNLCITQKKKKRKNMRMRILWHKQTKLKNNYDWPRAPHGNSVQDSVQTPMHTSLA